MSLLKRCSEPARSKVRTFAGAFALRLGDAVFEVFAQCLQAAVGFFAVAGAIVAGLLISSKDSREHAEAARRGEADPPAA